LQLAIVLDDRLRLRLLQQRLNLLVSRPFQHCPQGEAVTVARGELHPGEGRVVGSGLVIEPGGDRLGEPEDVKPSETRSR
jgi:hypothetical protein